MHQLTVRTNLNSACPLRKVEACQQVNWRKIAISNNVGGVKHYVRTPLYALIEERHFALLVALRFSNLGSL
jgi:hypothetical protein